MKISQTIAASVLVLGMGSAFAAEPVALNDTQMDNISAGYASATNSGGASALVGSASSSSTSFASHQASNCLLCSRVTDTAWTTGSAHVTGYGSAHWIGSATAY